MKIVEILKGLPASGKSTYALDKVSKGQGKWKRVNKDELRLMIDDGRWSKEREKFVINVRNELIKLALINGYNVIIDDTNLHPKHEKEIRYLVESINNLVEVEIRVKEFPITVQEAIKRDSKRGNKSVGAEVIWRMHNQFIRPGLKIKQNIELPPVILCDLDGTLCLHNGRGPFEYDKCDTDLVNISVAYIIYPHLSSPNRNVIYLSGREDSVKEKTLKWLKDNNLWRDKCALYMRKSGDYRKDYMVKKELFDQYIKDKYYVDFVLDDRSQVVELWRDLGLTCLQVADGDF